ncbi:polyadenylate binding protein, types 1, 2, 3, 4 family protein [Cryptosporidium meleagridis]|uniref:Polyadenylate-binding protein n=1 Tax=Cryptosporidium meleagridis TaxID=93969 RepID=A0A2P4Z3H0_9CRYT|nr:polyadenylate binding protein, types 1, 2, 3, 4 family protein [Cryptosporidium meleagridis]
MTSNNNVVPVSASLYVGDLDADVTETMLYEIFNSVAVVSSVRICRDALTRRSLGYAYVNYNSVADAERALDTLNFTCIRGRPCRIMWCLRDPASRRNNDGNVFVKNLDKSIDNKTLFDTFSLFGNIMSCKIATDVEGKSLGYGFIHFEHADSAKEAISRLNGAVLGDRPIYVGKFQKKAERFSEKDKTFTNVYVKHIPKSWTEDLLYKIFGVYGKISSLVLQSDSKGRPFGFVNFENPDSAKAAVAALHNALVTPVGVELNSTADTPADKEAGADSETSSKQESGEASNKKQTTSNETSKDSSGTSNEESAHNEDGSADKNVSADVQPNRLYVSRAQKKNERQVVLKSQHEAVKESHQRYQGVNLYVKNLADSISEEDLRSMFEPFGTVSSVSIKTDESGVSRGFGFVSFLSPDEATKAITEMHLKLVRGKPLYVGLHERKEQRALRLQQRIRGGAVPPVLRPGAIPPGPPGVHGAPMQFGVPPQMYFIPGNPNVAATAMPHGRAMVTGGFPNQNTMNNPWRPNPTRMPYTAGGVPPQMTGGPQMTAYNGSVIQQNGVSPNGAANATGSVQNGVAGNAVPGVQGTQNNRTGGNNQRIHNRHVQGNGQGGRPGSHSHQVQQMQKQGFKFPQNVKGSEMQRVDMIQNRQMDPSNGALVQNPLIPQPDVPLTAATLAAASPSMQKQLLGERLFPIIAQFQPELAGKITGMMLEMDNNELLELLSSDIEIKNKVDEAMVVLERAQQQIST